MSEQKITIEEMATFCKRKGFVYPNSEIYGGLAGFYDFGHLGVELKNNIKKSWWNDFVNKRDDVVGIDGTIINNPSVWKASGHIDGFTDILVDCKKCNARFRADQLVEDKLSIETAGLHIEELTRKIKENNIKCTKCGSELGELRNYNLMFSTNVGPIVTDKSTAYLRPETAQLMFTNFKLVADNARLKLPFGIAQIGKAFRNEISPRDFLFRLREFELMEIEYFVHPNKQEDCPFISQVLDHEVNIYSAKMQSEKKEMEKMTIGHALEVKVISTKWHAYWMAKMHQWYISLGANSDDFRLRQHVKDELSHYALDTWDLEFKFAFGWKELQGFANRTDFDLKQHMDHSKVDLSLFDEQEKKKVVPHVICEPAQGVERAFLVFMFSAYSYDAKRENVVLKLSPNLCPVKLAVFPLVSNKEELVAKARKIHADLKEEYTCQFDTSGSVGRRYSRADEIGIYACITVDFDSLTDDSVTIRSRDTAEQIRVKVVELKDVLRKFLNGEDLSRLGKKVA